MQATVPTMADEKATIDEALRELASLGRRITELASTFEARRDGLGEQTGPQPGAARGEDRAATADVAAGDLPNGDAPGTGRGAPEPAQPASPRQRRDGAPARPAESTASSSTAARSAPAAGKAAGRSARRRAGASGPQRRPRPPSPGFRWPWRGRPAGPMLVSCALHASALLALALIFVARPSPPDRLAIVSAPVQEEPLEDLAEVEIDEIDAVEPLEFEALPEPSFAELAAIDPAPVALEQPKETAERPTVDAGDMFAAGIDVGDLMSSLGVDGGEGEAGGGMADAATFFGRKGSGRTALFMCDNSASYVEGGFQAVLLELSRAVTLMKPSQSFHIVFFSDAAYPLLHPDGIDTFLPATPENKRKLDAWLGTVELCVGGQGIRGAADLALDLEPDVVYFLSDGDHAESVIDRMVALPLDGTVVHTFGMQADVRDRRTGQPDARKLADQHERNRKLTRIAEAHGGTFTPVTISPQAALAASVRPVRKNRTRGATWGMNLPIAP